MIHLNKLNKEIGNRSLFTTDKVTINRHDKIGLIGDNGVGKTSLLRILSGQDDDYQGQVTVDMKLASLLNDSPLADLSQDIFLKAGLENTGSYSPGEYQRLKLAHLLNEQADFLLIDEPTSHLDIEQKDHLISRLSEGKQGYLLISHDRDFINQTCDQIFELVNGQLEIYNGDYNFYLEERAKRKKFAQREYDKYISEKKRLMNVANDIKGRSDQIKSPPKRMGNSEARLHKMGGQANKKKLDKQVKAVESRIDQLEVKEKPHESSDISLTMEENEKIFSKTLIRAENLTTSFGDKIIFDQVNLDIPNQQKIALIGPNGSGKTTFFKLILDQQLWRHPNLRIGYYSQMGEILDRGKTILANVADSSIYDQTQTRMILAQLGFGVEEVAKQVAVLSDGERAKVKLAKLLTSDFNYLMLDEPTNFLDIRAIEALEELLETYDRPMLFITHDVSFINRIADGLLMIEDGQIKYFYGNLTQYHSHQEERAANRSEDDLLLDFRLTKLNSQLSVVNSEEEKEELQREFNRLISQRQNR